MLYKVSPLFGYALDARDGRLGKVKDLYFDDHVWRVRYLVVETGGWLNRRPVLISPAVLERPLTEEQCFPVKLTQQQVRDSPDIGTDLPVSRQMEESMLTYYSWPNYWLTDFEPGLTMPAAAAGAALPLTEPYASRADPHLRSVRDVTGYKAQALDESETSIGAVSDFILEGDDWTIRYVVLKGEEDREFVLNPWWTREIDWLEKTMYFDIPAAQIRSSPPFAPQEPFDRGYEENLYRHYGREFYWRKQ